MNAKSNTVSLQSPDGSVEIVFKPVNPEDIFAIDTTRPMKEQIFVEVTNLRIFYKNVVIYVKGDT